VRNNYRDCDLGKQDVHFLFGESTTCARNFDITVEKTVAKINNSVSHPHTFLIHDHDFDRNCMIYRYPGLHLYRKINIFKIHESFVTQQKFAICMRYQSQSIVFCRGYTSYRIFARYFFNGIW